MRLSLPRQTVLVVVTMALLAATSRADFIPITLTSDSFNQDVIVEKTAPSPIVPVTTASMEGGTSNIGFGWYEKGYNSSEPASGLPSPASIIQSDSFPDNTYQFAPTYKSNNAVLIDAMLTNGTLLLAPPAKFARLSFLLASGNGPGSIRATIHHQDSTTEITTNVCPDWMTSPGIAYQASGRVDVHEFIFDGVLSSYPRLFTRDLTISNPGNAVTSVEFSYIGGAAHNAVFAISGSTNLVDPFTPISVTGYNADLIVEASATRRENLMTATSASMENGTGNAGRTFYEHGYYPPEPNSGLPSPGTLLTNSLAPDHVFVMPPSYASNNGLMIDSSLDSGIVTPATPTAFAALSFLCASGHGPVTNQCVVQHANGLTESNNLVIPDWFENSSAAFIANGDLNLNTRMVDSLGANNPRLYSVDLPLANTVSPVTSVIIIFKGGSANSHSTIFALSGLGAQGTDTRPILSISRLAGGNLRINTSQAGQLQSTTALNGTNTVWQNEGIISSTLDVAPASGTSAKLYRVIGQ